ncbi:MAG: pyridoxine 5-phosphate oxidase [Bacteroidetes bacterium]|jgi:pyridoxamine 5'-phosphate oxidase|nr:pyridoxine 5-phosphate oxidase [Bacteroidota bacterium]MDF2450595.1 pyridoxine 5-phosphate oxidase [Bacteroidota bacterium]
MKEHISHMRNHYEGEVLDEKTVYPDPLEQFKYWFKEALNSKVMEPNAMFLATSDKSGIPALRTVLLKDVDSNGFTFYTNYNSRKGKEMEENPKACILFFWPELHRQVRVDGIVSKVDSAISEIYFKERPRGNQISAWVSPQSSEVKSKSLLEQNYKTVEEKYCDREVPYPEFWGGYCIQPLAFEFWQGQPNRLHDRIFYSFNEEKKSWVIKRLAP